MSRFSDWLNRSIDDSAIRLYQLYSIYASLFAMTLLILWHIVQQGFLKRLWLLPSSSRSRFLTLNAATLAIISIVAKPTKPGDGDAVLDVEQYMLSSMVLICAVVTAFMPSVAASTDVWSNVAGVGVLIISANFIVFLQLFYIEPTDPIFDDHNSRFPAIHKLAKQHEFVMASLFLLLLVLIVQAMALEAMASDVKVIVLEQLEQLRTDQVKPGYKADVVLMMDRPTAWSWKVVERNTCRKLMMVVTSNPQHMMARSPASAIAGAVVLSCIITLMPPSGFLILNGGVILLCGFICMCRWARIALQEDRPFLSLLSSAEPSYWRRKVNDFHCMLKAGTRHPKVLNEVTAFLMLCFVIPFHRLLVALIRFTHIISALLMQMLICTPLKSLLCCRIIILVKSLLGRNRQVEVGGTDAESDCLGVVCLEGEDRHIVHREFAGAVHAMVRKQLTRAAKTKSDLKALVSLLQRSKSTSSLVGKSTYILQILHHDNAPYVKNLHVEHGYQYGWSLTVVSLLAIMADIEVAALESSEISEAAMDAYWQAMEMVQVVDEQFVPCIVCPKETYARACASVWSKLQMKKRRYRSGSRYVCRYMQSDKTKQASRQPKVKLDAVDQVLKAILEPVERQMEEFNKTRCTSGDCISTIAWPLQIVVAYTMHTVCRGLLRWWTDLENARVANNQGEGGGGGGGGESNASEIIKAMVEHISVLIAEVLTCCLSNLSTALDMSTTDAVLNGSVGKVEKGLFLVGQGKYLWEEQLQWPTLHSPASGGLGQIGQWIHIAQMSNIASAT